MIIRGLLLLILALLPTTAFAQAPAVLQCTGADASVTSTTQVVVIAACSIVAGPKGIVYATGQAETTCGATANEGVQLLIGTTAPTLNAAPPGGMTGMTNLLHQDGCNYNPPVFTSLAGSFAGSPGFRYYITVTLSTSDPAQPATWNNQTIMVLTY